MPLPGFDQWLRDLYEYPAPIVGQDEDFNPEDEYEQERENE